MNEPPGADPDDEYAALHERWRSVYEDPAVEMTAKAYDRRAVDDFVLMPAHWAIARDAEFFPLVAGTILRVLKIDSEPHLPPARLLFTIDSDTQATIRSLEWGADVYGEEEDSS